MPDVTPPEQPPLVHARGLGLTGPRGPVYAGVDLAVAPGDLAAITGSTGSGRTSLLLTLAGRMRPTTGSLVVAGHPLPRHVGAVQRVSGLAEIAGVNALEPRMTAAEHVHERLALTAPWWHLGLARSRATAERTRAVLAAPGGERIPDDVPVADLPAPQRWQLGLALALVGGPRLVVVDDLDSALPHGEDVADAWRTLRRLADTGVTVVAACTDPARIPAHVTDAAVHLALPSNRLPLGTR